VQHGGEESAVSGGGIKVKMKKKKLRTVARVGPITAGAIDQGGVVKAHRLTNLMGVQGTQKSRSYVRRPARVRQAREKKTRSSGIPCEDKRELM